MATSPINIDTNCSGTFIVDAEGIRSTEPIDLKRAYWDGNTFHLKGENSGMNNVVIHNGTNMFNGLFGSVGQMTIGSISGISNTSEYVTIDGVRYKREGNVSRSDETMFNEPWSKTGRENVVLEGISMSGDAKFEVKIPLDESCDIDASGASSVDVYGDNSDSTLNISLSGATRVSGNGRVKKLVSSLSGASNVNGFTAVKQLRAKASGASNINLKYVRGCAVNKHQSGVAAINLNEV